MNNVIKITGKTLFEPIKLDIKGKVYTVPPISFQTLEKANKLDEIIKSGSDDALKSMYDQVKLFLPQITSKVLFSLTIEEVQEIRETIPQKLFSFAERKEEKNVLKPEEESLPS